MPKNVFKVSAYWTCDRCELLANPDPTQLPWSKGICSGCWDELLVRLIVWTERMEKWSDRGEPWQTVKL